MKDFTLRGLKKILMLPSKEPGALVAQAAFGPVPAVRASKHRRGDLTEFLRRVSLFEDLGAGDLERLARSGHERTYRDGESIYEQGTPGAALFLLRSGVVEIRRRRPHGEEVPILTLEPPASFSEQAAVGVDAARWTSAVARGPVSLLAFGRSDLDSLSRRFPVLANKVLYKLAQITAQRLQILVDAQFLAEERSVTDGEPPQ